ncbi:MAG: hypothetical protein FRX49_06548 [Trebouxia sp. A1-2]|nr:MAG: hypothetical protein FRX49_06548 [Trebouxia sp. A1-2]
MSAAAMLRIHTTDELGLVKVVEAPSYAQIDLSRVVQTWGEPSRAAAINCLSAEACSHIAVGRPGGVEVLQSSSGAVEGFVAAAGVDDRTPSGVCLLPSVADSLPSLLSCSRGGLMRLHAMSQEDGSSQCSFREELSWQSMASVECMAVHARDTATHIALACNGSELGIWDLQKQQRSYHAKGNKPNRIGLVDKPWNTAAAFLPGSDGQKVVLGTAYHKLRLYDVKSRRPALDIDFGEAKVTALAAQTNGMQVWAGSGMGKIECLDLRMNKLQGSLKGPGGAVKSLALHPELPIIASVGLDRFLRIHNLDSKALLCKLYLKQHLTAVAWGSMQHEAAEAEEGAADTVGYTAADVLKPHVLTDDAVEDAGRKRARPSSSKTAGSHKKGRSQRKKPKLPVQN